MQRCHWRHAKCKYVGQYFWRKTTDGSEDSVVFHGEFKQRFAFSAQLQQNGLHLIDLAVKPSKIKPGLLQDILQAIGFGGIRRLAGTV
jgi:hypothetical protein